MSTNWIRPWADLTNQMVQMYWAVPQVVTQRVARMLHAGPAPSARDRREFHRMGSEKWDAARASVAAMGMRTLVLQQQYVQQAAAFWWRHAFGGWARPRGWQQWAQGRPLQAWADLLDVAARGVRPVSRRAVANSRRLARLRRR